MGASSTTPHLNLPQFADGDKPTWRGDVNAAFSILDDAIHGKADKATIDYYVANYYQDAQVPGDSAANDMAAILACIDDAYNNGGGIVHSVRGKTLLVNDEIFVKNNVLFMGTVGNYNGIAGAINVPTLKFVSAAARIRVGAYQGRFGSVNGDNPTGLQYMLIDCNGFGSTDINDGAIYVQGTGLNLQSLHIQNAAGYGIYCDATQNSEFTGVDVQNCAVGICLDNGVGGLLFTRCEISDNMIGILSLDNQSMSNGYPLGVAHTVFQHCVIENYKPITVEVDIQAGTVQFNHCGFSNNVAATAPTDDTLVKISNPIYPGISTNAVFDSCIFVSQAGEHCITIVGPNKFYAYGQTYLQGSFDAAVNTTALLQDSGVGIGQLDGNVYQLQIDKLADVANGGSLFNWFVTRTNTEMHEVDTTINAFAILIRELGDAGIRFAVAGDGSINWYDGTTYDQKAALSLTAALKTLYFNNAGHQFQGAVEFDEPVKMDQNLEVDTDLHVLGTSLLDGKVDITTDLEVHNVVTVHNDVYNNGPVHNAGVVNNAAQVNNNGIVHSTGAKIEPTPAIYAPAGGGAVDVDMNLTLHAFVVITGTGDVTALNITNAVDGSRLKMSYFVSDGAPRNVFWPAGATAAPGKALPASLAEIGLHTIEFFNFGGNWFEIGRNF